MYSYVNNTEPTRYRAYFIVLYFVDIILTYILLITTIRRYMKE